LLKSIFVNTGSNFLVLFIKLVITFVMTPIIIHSLGNYDYGLWEMLVAVVGYMGILDLGIKPAISRFSAKLKAENDRDGLLEVYNTALVYMLGVGVLLLVVFVAWALWLPDSIAPEGSPTKKYTILLLILGAQLLIMFPGYVAESFLEGFQLYYVKNIITIINSIIGSSVIYFIITPENGLLLLAGMNAVGTSIKYLLFFALLLRPNFGSMNIELKKFSIKRLKEILIFGGKSLIQGIGSRLEQATDSLVIGILLGPMMVPLYSVPANLTRYISAIGMNLTHVFMPLFSDLYARQQHEKIVQIYMNASKWVVAIIMPLAAGIAITGAPFISIWIGDEYGKNADGIIILLVIFISSPFLNPFYSRYLTAINEHGILAKLSPISAVINLTSSIFLVREFGIIGAAIGSVLPIFIFMPIYLKRSCHHLGISVLQYIRVCVVPSFLPVALMTSALALFRVQHGITNYMDLFYAVILGAGMYGILFWMMSLSDFEKNFIKQKFKSLLIR